MGVFELTEAELRVGLGPVGGHDVADGPVVLIGDKYSFAEYFRFQCAAGVVVDGEGESVLGRRVSDCLCKGAVSLRKETL